MKPLVIGLTGPIGCGKSTVARMLGELGGLTIDADVLARKVTEPGGEALPQIRARFGDHVVDSDGKLDRAELAAIAFADEAALADLERIVHPHVRQLVNKQLAAAEREQAAFVAIEAFKLVEGGLADRCDVVWLVECQPPTQSRRLAERDAPAEDSERRLGAQGPRLIERLAARLAGRGGIRRLSTEGSIAETRARVEAALASALDRP